MFAQVLPVAGISSKEISRRHQGRRTKTEGQKLWT